jgi:hypothetical protein
MFLATCFYDLLLVPQWQKFINVDLFIFQNICPPPPPPDNSNGTQFIFILTSAHVFQVSYKHFTSLVEQSTRTKEKKKGTLFLRLTVSLI